MELIITEKPSACKKVAESLTEGKIETHKNKKVTYYTLQHQGKDITVACAVGHLYTVTEKDKKGWTYPVFDIEWKPSYEVNKESFYTKEYLDTIKKLTKEAKEYTIATDYDVEGEVIGERIIHFLTGKSKANRMKFSTTTKEDLIKAYEHKSKCMDLGLAEAGITRHMLDYLHGINLSRALTLSIKNAANRFKIMSTGRVQGPALKVLYEKEKEIEAFKSEPYWELNLEGEKDKDIIYASHEKERFWNKKEVEATKARCTSKEAKVKDIKQTKTKIQPPTPFDLTTLQTESYATIGISPKETLEIAQDLYINSYISYPRTSSQKLPESIEYKKIINKLAKSFPNECEYLIKKKILKPNEGQKTDAAHPAIYPTGELPKKLEKKSQDLYELIVRRFFATFGEEAEKENSTIKIDLNSEIFITKGSRTTVLGWQTLYGRFVKTKDEELPKLKIDDKIKVKKLEIEAKETQPPKRYTEASIIKELEKRNLGTKCLTENNLIKIKSKDKTLSIKISELYTLLSINLTEKKRKKIKIIENTNIKCFCFDEGKEEESIFSMISKRQLDKKERVLRIEYFDGSFIEVTDKHPLLILDKEKIKYTPAKKLKPMMKSISSDKKEEKEGSIFLEWEAFLKKCDKNTKLYGNSEELKKIRESKGISQAQIAKELGINQSSITVYEKFNFLPLYLLKDLKIPTKIRGVNKNVLIKNPFPIKYSSPLVRLCANLVGDGSIDTKKIKKENCYDFRYHNTNINLINRFKEDIKKIFNIELEIKIAKTRERHLPKYYLRVPGVIGRIISIIFPEVIKKNAINLPKIFYPEYIGALFDDEGHAGDKEQKIFISNTNFKLLNKVKNMLKELNVNASINEKQYKLHIRGKENLKIFLELIPLASENKKQRIINFLTNKYNYRTGSIIKKEKDILAAIKLSKNKELTAKEISEKTKIPIVDILGRIKYLRKEGYLTQKTIGISEYPRKKILYVLKRDLENSVYKYLGEQVISQDFITKTIKDIEEIKYKNEVYDISNTIENPNFILGNGIIVHNSTRAQIIENLYDRNYIKDKSIQVTDLGKKTVETLLKYSPKILDEELTRSFEEKMEEIQEGKTKSKEVIDENKKVLDNILTNFKKKEKEIGKELAEANIETELKESDVGPCPKCKKGTLRLRRGKFGQFIACDRYEEGCKTTFSIPRGALVKNTEKKCNECNYPIILVIRKGRRPQEFCINPDCKTKEATIDVKGKKCPNCGKDLIVKKGPYGAFAACPGYPKCKYIENSFKKSYPKKEESKTTVKKVVKKKSSKKSN